MEILIFFKISFRRFYAVSDSDSSIFEDFGMWPIHFWPAGAAGMGFTHQAQRLKKRPKKYRFTPNRTQVCLVGAHTLWGGILVNVAVQTLKLLDQPKKHPVLENLCGC